MGKYINADHLRAILQKKLESYKSKMVDPLKYPIDHIDLMALLAREYQALILQIDSLQQERQGMDVEKEIEDYAYSLPHSTTGSSAYVSDKRLPIARQFGIKHAWSFEYVMEIAMHSYELGFNARKEESK